MLDLRSPLILGAVPAGLAMGAAAWLLVGGGAFAAGQIAPYEQRFAKMSFAGGSIRRPASDSLSQTLSAPIFALTTGHGAVADVTIRLDGVARSPRHTAALISIGGKPADWLELGQTRDEVTLQEVRPSSIVVDTPIGFKTIDLGDTTTSAQASGADRPSGQPGAPAGAPSGYRMPPPPASAPGLGG